MSRDFMFRACVFVILLLTCIHVAHRQYASNEVLTKSFLLQNSNVGTIQTNTCHMVSFTKNYLGRIATHAYKCLTSSKLVYGLRINWNNLESIPKKTSFSAPGARLCAPGAHVCAPGAHGAATGAPGVSQAYVRRCIQYFGFRDYAGGPKMRKKSGHPHGETKLGVRGSLPFRNQISPPAAVQTRRIHPSGQISQFTL
jgi:hypothetical protein